MYKMVIQAVMMAAAAFFFIMTRSDGLRTASNSGDISAIAQVAAGNGDGLSGISGAIADAQSGGIEWSKYDPRRLWKDRPKTIKLAPKTIQASSDTGGQSIEELLTQKGIDPSTVTFKKLD